MSDDNAAPPTDQPEHALKQEIEKVLSHPEGGTAGLEKALTELKARESQPVRATPSVEPTFFGMTGAALFAGLVMSSIGMGFFVYAKSERQPLFFVFGVMLLGLPFFVTDALALVVVGAGLVLVPMLLKRYLNW